MGNLCRQVRRLGRWLRREVVETSVAVDLGNETQVLRRLWRNPIHPLNLLDDLIDHAVCSRLDLAVWDDDGLPPYDVVIEIKTRDKDQCP